MSGCLGDLYLVVDVTADPGSGTPTDAATGVPITWANSFTARRGLFGVEVLDRQGTVVLTTDARYWMCPAAVIDGVWVIGGVGPCHGGELGAFQSLRGKAGPHCER